MILIPFLYTCDTQTRAPSLMFHIINLHKKMKTNADDEEAQQLRSQFLESLNP